MKRRYFYIAGAGLFLGGFYLGGKCLVSIINEQKTRADRNSANMYLFSDWLAFLYSGDHIEEYFHKKGFQKIMIYGNGFIGARLVQALQKTDVEIVAVMDKAACSGVDGVIGTDSDIPDSDCIIVTPVFYYEEIYDMLKERTNIPIVSIGDVWKE